MPIDPGPIGDLAGLVRQIADEGLLRVNTAVSRALARGSDTPKWAEEKMAELNRLQAALQADLTATARRISGEIAWSTENAYMMGASQALTDTGASTLFPTLPAARSAALGYITSDLSSNMRMATAQALRSINDTYQQIVGQTVAQMALGTMTRRQATQAAIDKFAAEGVGDFRDASGRRWNLGSYAEMATRTGTMHAAIQGHLDTLAAGGDDLVYVIPGPRACPICDGFAGKVLSISGADGKHMAMAEARAAGLFHPNCRCSSALYVEGFSDTTPVRPSDSGYQAAQDQRYLERGIRKWKSKAAIAVDPTARARANAKVKEWNRALTQHLDAHPDLKRLAYREVPFKPTAGKPLAPVAPTPVKELSPKALLEQRIFEQKRIINDPRRNSAADITAAKRQLRTLQAQLKKLDSGVVAAAPAPTRPYELKRPPVRTIDEVMQQFVNGGYDINFDHERPEWQQVARSVRDTLAEAVKHGVTIQIEGRAMESLVQDGRFKNAFEVGKNRGGYLKDRMKYETHHIGIPESVPETQRPIYGWGVDPGGVAETYGDVQVNLKKSVLARTSWTMDDSFNQLRPVWSDEVPTLTDAQAVSSVNEYSAHRMVERSLEEGWSPDRFQEKMYDNIGYIEAQVHGGVSVSDIESVIVPRSYADDTPWVAALRKQGIRIIRG